MKRMLFLLIILVALITFCSCARKKGLRNNLKTVDMSQFSKTISAANTDSRVEDNYNNSQDENLEPQTGVSAQQSNTYEEDDDVGSKSNSSSGSMQPSGNSSDSNGGGTEDGMTEKERKKLIKDLLNSGSKSHDAAENGNGTELDINLIPEKYLIYLPTIIEEIEQIDRTDYGVTVHFMPTSQERFDQYVTELKSMGFIMDASLSGTSFSAHTKDGIYVKFIVTTQESWLAIYDDAKHLG